MFINLSNHPSSGWNKRQLEAARQFGEIVDMPFPNVDEQATSADILRLAGQYLKSIEGKGMVEDLTVHIMGEQTFCYALISKLQKKGIRCVASCTAHDTFINEQGQKVSSFHFTRFREYGPMKSKALKRWWERRKKKLSVLFCGRACLRRNRFYSSTALILVLLFELLMIGALQFEKQILGALSIIVFCLLPVLFLLGRFMGQSFRFASPIVTKLLANAVTPSFLGTLYLFLFVVHIGWLTNAVLGWYTAEGDEACRVWLSTSVCFLGILFLVLFFPKGTEQKVNEPQRVFISGISAIPTKEDILNNMTYDSLNLLPLVRILQLAKYDSVVPRIVVLQTDVFKDTKSYDNAFRHVLGLINQEACPLFDNCSSVNEKLELLIREAAKREFPELAEIKQPEMVSFIDKISIEFTEACNYSRNFEKAYSVLEEKTKGLDDIHHSLYFNLTPGTGIIGSLMTLMAIDGDRHLYYYSQEKMPPLDSEEEKRKFRESMVLPVDKSKVPLQALLSQALEKQD